MTDILVPRLNSVDDRYVLLEWVVADGIEVTAGEVIAVVETSKAATDLEATADGVLHHLVAAGDECAVGQILATVGVAAKAEPEPPAPVPRTSAPPAAEPEPASFPVLTDRARRLAEQHGVTPEQIRSLGRGTVRESDIRGLVDSAPGDAPAAAAGKVISLSANQLGVKAAVERAHRDIPTAYAGLHIRVDAAIGFAQQYSRTHRAMIGLNEVIISAVARQRDEFPEMFATFVDQGSVSVPDTANVGVTTDTGNGLYVVVVPDAGALALAELSRALMRLRRRTMTGQITAGELSGAGIVVALNSSDEIAVALPIVFPGNVACVSVCATHTELELAEDGGVRTYRRAHVGLAYDHRLINGRQAGAFLGAIKRSVEAPESWE